MELQVAVDKTDTVVPCLPTDSTRLYLHNIDQQLFFNLEMLFFYSATENPVDVVKTLREALPKVLVPYHFAAGRCKVNKKQGRLELLCNAAGALFAEACCDFSISELGDLAAPNPNFKKLLLYPADARSISQVPLLTVQVTKFACGGFVMGFCANHVIFDGVGLCKFFNDYAGIARHQINANDVHATADKTFLKARSPPHIISDHKEFCSLPDLPAKLFFDPAAFSQLGHPVPPKYSFKSFAFTPMMLKSLKRKAVAEESDLLQSCSAFEALAAHIWQSRTKTMRLDPEQPSKLFIVMDMRKKLNFQHYQNDLSSGLTGNAIFAAPCVDVPAQQVTGGSLGSCVVKVQQTIRSASEDFIRSQVDWCEVNPHGAIDLPGGLLITPWSKLGFDHVDFGSGPPVYVAPLVHARTEYVIVLSNCKGDGGLDVFMAMEFDKMNELEKHLLTI